MKISNILLSLLALAIGAGCKSHEARTESRTTVVSQQVTQTPAPSQAESVGGAEQSSFDSTRRHVLVETADYTIETIPNPHLSATSREGDRTNEMYSSNIIAVYAHPKGTTVSSTNSSPFAGQGNNPQSK